MGLQSDGKMLVAGRTHSGSGPNHRDAVIVRLLPDGSLDNAFGSGGVVRYTTVNLGCFNPEWFFDLLVLDDDRFLAAGYDQRGCDAPYRDFLVVRYQADGTVDQVFSEYPSFHGNRDEAQAVAVQADGKVLAAGWAQSVSGQDATTDVAVARWNPDGTLDTSFDGEGEWLLDVNGDMDRIDAVVVQPDGKIVLAGQTRVNDQTDWLVIRLHPDGSLDTSFDGDGMLTLDHAGFNDAASGLLLQDDGTIVVGGTVSPDGATNDAMVVCLNPDGTLDTAFGTGGQVLLDHAGQDNTGSALAWHDGDKILVAGRTFDGTYHHFALTRVLPDGTPDVHFGVDGWHITAFDTSSSIAGAVAVQSDHRILLAGHTESVPDIDDRRDIALARYDLLEGNTLYVNDDATGANDGSSWADAYTDLQSALAAAQDGDQIWVAEGVYYPTAGTDRNVAFTLKSGVEIYGGFAGTETSLDQRDWQAHPTVLSGDIDTNDTNDDGNFIAESWSHIVSSNSYNVVRGSNVDSTAVLDGFIITAGRANSNGSGNVGEGGGIYLTSNAAPTLRNLTISGSYVFRGGGLSTTAGSYPTLTDVSFTGNRSDSYGGGMYVVDGAATLTRVTFVDNRAENGGGLYADESTLTATETTFCNNTGDVAAGLYAVRSTLELDTVTFDSNSGQGAYIPSSTATIANSSFTNNTAGSGGGIYVGVYSVITIRNTSFIGNTALAQGGGIYLFKEATLVGTDLTFRDNTADGDGGGFAVGSEGNSVTLTRVVFENNSAQSGGAIYLDSEQRFSMHSVATIEDFVVTGNTGLNGGGIYVEGGDSWTLRRGLIHSNTAGGQGGGVYLLGGAFATLENVTISGNTAEGGFGGGGIFHQGESLTLRNVTITGNTATTSGEGEGLYVSGPAGSLTMVNTIVAGNGSEDLFRDGPHDSAFIVRHSLIQRQRNAGLNDGVDGNLIGQDPLLGPLADNGGFSLTHALLPGSPAIDAGTSEGAPEEDQRGVSRPQGQAIDMGAYESDDATTSIEDEQEVVPAEFALHQNYPNPFDQVTHMSFGLPAPLPVRLVVYDVLGREVRTLVDEPLPAGWHRASWDGRDEAGRAVAAGLYVVRLHAGDHVRSRTLVRLR